ncbi:DNA polymerase III subunit delta [Kamptonema cortianum]|nr:DNA polymerase III subunit delta [Oscillatoria laete-virens]MDK3158026.1 DNA polymerase III subunit delta [Kamptonema cortianum]MDL5048205.1 DNA polymerase III subunit delta [Oscillatoria amoena NRMC-F 0135]MDL5053098.1 DNA polymerase III subunit delta [Oscillatoria laete-virens NRMC-F 0139]
MPPAPSISAYLVTGSDELKVREESKALADKLAASAGEFGLETIDAQAENAEHVARICANCLEALQTIPFLGGDKVVWLKNANFLDDSMLGKTNAATEGLAAIAALVKAGLPTGVNLLVSAANCDKRKSFYKTLEKNGEIRLHDAVDTSKRNWEGKVEDEIRERLEKEGVRIAPDAALLLAECVGGDTLVLGKELEKLILYAGDEKIIREEAIRLIVSPSREQIAWELGDALMERDAGHAMEVLERLLFQGNAPLPLLATLISKVRQTLLAKELMDVTGIRSGNDFNGFKAQLARAAQSLADRMPDDPKYNPLAMNPFVLFKAAQAAARFTKPELIRAMDVLTRTYKALIHSSEDAQIALETAIIRIAGKKKSPATSRR